MGEEECTNVLIEKIRRIKRLDVLQYIDIIVSDILEEEGANHGED